MIVNNDLKLFGSNVEIANTINSKLYQYCTYNITSMYFLKVTIPITYTKYQTIPNNILYYL